MITLRRRLENAAFWAGWICLECSHVVQDDEEAEGGKAECPECGGTPLTSAIQLSRFLRRLEGEETTL